MEHKMIKISESAKIKIKNLIEEEGDPNLKLRIYVQGGGCSGFQYGFSFEEDNNDDDVIIYDQEIKVISDIISLQYLENSEISYTEDLTGSSFSIKNPNAQTTCGCGSSFSV